MAFSVSPEVLHELLRKNFSKRPEDRLSQEELNVLRAVRAGVSADTWKEYEAVGRAAEKARKKAAALAAEATAAGLAATATAAGYSAAAAEAPAASFSQQQQQQQATYPSVPAPASPPASPVKRVPLSNTVVAASMPALAPLPAVGSPPQPPRSPRSPTSRGPPPTTTAREVPTSPAAAPVLLRGSLAVRLEPWLLRSLPAVAPSPKKSTLRPGAVSDVVEAPVSDSAVPAALACLPDPNGWNLLHAVLTPKKLRLFALGDRLAALAASAATNGTNFFEAAAAAEALHGGSSSGLLGPPVATLDLPALALLVGTAGPEEAALPPVTGPLAAASPHLLGLQQPPPAPPSPFGFRLALLHPGGPPAARHMADAAAPPRAPSSTVVVARFACPNPGELAGWYQALARGAGYQGSAAAPTAAAVAAAAAAGLGLVGPVPAPPDVVAAVHAAARDAALPVALHAVGNTGGPSGVADVSTLESTASHTVDLSAPLPPPGSGTASPPRVYPAAAAGGGRYPAAAPSSSFPSASSSSSSPPTSSSSGVAGGYIRRLSMGEAVGRVSDEGGGTAASTAVASSGGGSSSSGGPVVYPHPSQYPQPPRGRQAAHAGEGSGHHSGGAPSRGASAGAGAGSRGASAGPTGDSRPQPYSSAYAETAASRMRRLTQTAHTAAHMEALAAHAAPGGVPISAVIGGGGPRGASGGPRRASGGRSATPGGYRGGSAPSSAAPSRRASVESGGYGQPHGHHHGHGYPQQQQQQHYQAGYPAEEAGGYYQHAYEPEGRHYGSRHAAHAHHHAAAPHSHSHHQHHHRHHHEEEEVDDAWGTPPPPAGRHHGSPSSRHHHHHHHHGHHHEEEGAYVSHARRSSLPTGVQAVSPPQDHAAAGAYAGYDEQQPPAHWQQQQRGYGAAPGGRPPAPVAARPPAPPQQQPPRPHSSHALVPAGAPSSGGPRRGRSASGSSLPPPPVPASVVSSSLNSGGTRQLGKEALSSRRVLSPGVERRVMWGGQRWPLTGQVANGAGAGPESVRLSGSVAQPPSRGGSIPTFSAGGSVVSAVPGQLGSARASHGYYHGAHASSGASVVSSPSFVGTLAPPPAPGTNRLLEPPSSRLLPGGGASVAVGNRLLDAPPSPAAPAQSSEAERSALDALLSVPSGPVDLSQRLSGIASVARAIQESLGGGAGGFGSAGNATNGYITLGSTAGKLGTAVDAQSVALSFTSASGHGGYLSATAAAEASAYEAGYAAASGGFLPRRLSLTSASFGGPLSGLSFLHDGGMAAAGSPEGAAREGGGFTAGLPPRPPAAAHPQPSLSAPRSRSGSLASSIAPEGEDASPSPAADALHTAFSGLAGIAAAMDGILKQAPLLAGGSSSGSSSGGGVAGGRPLVRPLLPSSTTGSAVGSPEAPTAPPTVATAPATPPRGPGAARSGSNSFDASGLTSPATDAAVAAIIAAVARAGETYRAVMGSSGSGGAQPLPPRASQGFSNGGGPPGADAQATACDVLTTAGEPNSLPAGSDASTNTSSNEGGGSEQEDTVSSSSSSSSSSAFVPPVVVPSIYPPPPSSSSSSPRGCAASSSALPPLLEDEEDADTAGEARVPAPELGEDAEDALQDPEVLGLHAEAPSSRPSQPAPPHSPHWLPPRRAHVPQQQPQQQQEAESSGSPGASASAAIAAAKAAAAAAASAAAVAAASSAAASGGGSPSLTRRGPDPGAPGGSPRTPLQQRRAPPASTSSRSAYDGSGSSVTMVVNAPVVAAPTPPSPVTPPHAHREPLSQDPNPLHRAPQTLGSGSAPRGTVSPPAWSSPAAEPALPGSWGSPAPHPAASPQRRGPPEPAPAPSWLAVSPPAATVAEALPFQLHHHHSPFAMALPGEEAGASAATAYRRPADCVTHSLALVIPAPDSPASAVYAAAAAEARAGRGAFTSAALGGAAPAYAVALSPGDATSVWGAPKPAAPGGGYPSATSPRARGGATPAAPSALGRRELATATAFRRSLARAAAAADFVSIAFDAAVDTPRALAEALVRGPAALTSGARRPSAASLAGHLLGRGEGPPSARPTAPRREATPLAALVALLGAPPAEAVATLLGGVNTSPAASLGAPPDALLPGLVAGLLADSSDLPFGAYASLTGIAVAPLSRTDAEGHAWRRLAGAPAGAGYEEEVVDLLSPARHAAAAAAATAGGGGDGSAGAFPGSARVGGPASSCIILRRALLQGEGGSGGLGGARSAVAVEDPRLPFLKATGVRVRNALEAGAVCAALREEALAAAAEHRHLLFALDILAPPVAEAAAQPTLLARVSVLVPAARWAPRDAGWVVERGAWYDANDVPSLAPDAARALGLPAVRVRARGVALAPPRDADYLLVRLARSSLIAAAEGTSAGDCVVVVSALAGGAGPGPGGGEGR